MITARSELADLERAGRPLPTIVHLPDAEPRWPLVVFAHGWMGHPRKFTRLFDAWTGAGYAVAAPIFPFTNETASGREFDDVANQPADVGFVLARLLEDPRFDADRVAVGGFSLGAVTALGFAFGRPAPGPPLRAVAAISGRRPGSGVFDARPCPLLVVHGRHDEIVPYAGGLKVYRQASAPKALLTIELPGHDAYVQNEPRTEADGVVAEVTTAFLQAALGGTGMPRPLVDERLARLESEGIW